MVTVKNKIIKNFFSKEELEVLQKYCYNKLNVNKDYTVHYSVESPGWYDDALMNSFLETKLPLLEEQSKLKLFPTYAYWRYYVFGGKLKKHTDRPACEVSVTVCIKKYDNWPIVIEGNKIELEEGDAVLYAGCEQEHWRPGIYKGEGMAQVFFHYVNKNGPFTHHQYDNVFINTSTQGTPEDFEIKKLRLKELKKNK
tara:strand:+ start:558 stop:1148 length:591 start_codon:yes stop_codon:yes gene_type:complete